jgi:hypothetical protein
MSKNVMEHRIARADLCKALFENDPPTLRNESVTFVYGVSGVGKSVLCDQLVDRLDLNKSVYISTGTIARKLVDSGESEIGGEYYNDECALWRELAKEWFSALCVDENRHILIDGYLRRSFQVVRVMDFMLHKQECAVMHPGKISFIYVEQETADANVPQFEGVNAARMLLNEGKKHENEIHIGMGTRAKWRNYVLPHWTKDKSKV